MDCSGWLSEAEEIRAQPRRSEIKLPGIDFGFVFLGAAAPHGALDARARFKVSE